MRKTVIINGMSCSHCATRVEKALNNIDGVEAKVELINHLASLKLSKEVSDEVIRAAINDVGYEVTDIA